MTDIFMTKMIPIGLMTSEYAKKLDYHNFINSELLSYTLIVDLLSDDKVLLNHSPSPPTGLEVNPYDSGSLKTKLSWEVSSDPSVISYKIYSKEIIEPHLKFVGTTTATSYETDNLWAENSTIVTRFYAVSAVKGDGTESFLSEMVENNDRDHDGLTDQEEITYGSLVDDPDSDDDGLLDGREFSRGTNPLLADTDGDQVSDYDEIQGGSDPLDENSVPLLPCEGDFDIDGDVDGSDLAVFAADFGRTDCGTGQDCEGDFDGDGDVDGSDLATFAADFGRTDCP